MSSKKQHIFYGWAIVAVVTIIVLLVIANPFSVVLKQLMNEFHSSRGVISLAPSLSTISAAIAGLFIGRLLINHNPKKFMLWGSIFGGICVLLISLTNELWQIFVLYFLSGVAIAGAGSIPVFTLLSKWFVKKYGIATGLTMAGGGIGFMLITPLFGIIAEHLGWRATYVFLGAAILIINVPLILFAIKDSPEKMGLLADGATKETDNNVIEGKKISSDLSLKQDKLDLSAFLKKPALWLLGMGFLIIQVCESAVTIHQVTFITDMGIREAVAASALGFTYGLSTLTRLGSGWLADRISSRYVAIIFLLIEIAGMLLLLRATTIGDIWLFVIVYGLGIGASSTLLPIVLRDVFGSTTFSMLFAVIDVFYKIGLSFGAPFAGFVFDATGSYHMVFIIVIALYVLAAILLYIAFGIRPRPFIKIRE